jgi:putative copper export protein
MGELAARAMPGVSVLVLVLGILRGTVLGPINSFEDLGTAYGITFLVALIVTLGLFYTGIRYVGPAYKALADEPDFEAAGARLRRFAQFDLVLFFIIFTCMILMRFGL